MRALLGKRLLSFPVGFYVVILAMVGIGTASGLGLGDGPVFAMTLSLSTLVIIFWAIPESTRR